MLFKDNKNELEKQIMRINALEYHIKNLLDFEKKSRLSLNRNADLQLVIDEVITEKFAHHVENEKRMQEKIATLESQIASLMEHKGTQVIYLTESEEPSKLINMRLNALEEGLVKFNEVQATLMNRIDELTEKYDALINEKEEVKANTETVEKEPNFGCLYIDKLYLDKYEQNNNFANLGIKTLSGALNIGATYGSVDIPKDIGKEVKEEMEKLKAEKNKAKSDTAQMNTNTLEVAQSDKDDDFPFTDIAIDED